MPTCGFCSESFANHRDAANHIQYGHEIPPGDIDRHIVESTSDQQVTASTPATTGSTLLAGSGGKAPAILLAHWHHLIEGLQTSSLGFYESLDQALQRRGVPDASGARVDYREAGLLSDKRE